MNIISTFVANLKASEAIEPSSGALDYPAVSAKSFSGLDPFACDPDLYVALGNPTAYNREVISLVCMQFAGTLTRSTSPLPDRFNGIKYVKDHLAVMRISGR